MYTLPYLSASQIEGNLATIPIGAAVVTDSQFGKGRHVIDFQIFSGSAVIGTGKSPRVFPPKALDLLYLYTLILVFTLIFFLI